MRPSQSLLKIIALWMLAAAAILGFRIASHYDSATFTSIASNAQTLWWTTGILLFIVVIFDWLQLYLFKRVSASRRLADNLALGVHNQVTLTVTNSSRRKITLDLTDHHPNLISTDNLPISSSVDAHSERTVTYTILPIQRGKAVFRDICLRVTSHLGFWQKKIFTGETTIARVYPNFAPIAQFASVGLEHQVAQLGAHMIQRRGEGLDFHQLREFREGDSLRQIDWKATARCRKPISKDYQDERDQDIIFLLDCGRGMRNQDDQLSHFDHALNAVLITSYIALRQGDAAGLLSFAGDKRWLSPVKGRAGVNSLLNQLYDLQSSTQCSDYLQAAQNLIAHHRKRALVVLITNIRDEQSDDLTGAVKLLSKYHMVMVASLRDDLLDELSQAPVNDFDDALSYSGNKLFVHERDRLVSKLQGTGISLVDSQAKYLHIELVNEYLRLKRGGLL